MEHQSEKNDLKKRVQIHTLERPNFFDINYIVIN